MADVEGQSKAGSSKETREDADNDKILPWQRREDADNDKEDNLWMVCFPVVFGVICLIAIPFIPDNKGRTVYHRGIGREVVHGEQTMWRAMLGGAGGFLLMASVAVFFCKKDDDRLPDQSPEYGQRNKVQASGNNRSKSSDICRQWNEGPCSLGGMCRYKHVCSWCADHGKPGENHKASSEECPKQETIILPDTHEQGSQEDTSPLIEASIDEQRCQDRITPSADTHEQEKQEDTSPLIDASIDEQLCQDNITPSAEHLITQADALPYELDPPPYEPPSYELHSYESSEYQQQPAFEPPSLSP